jgi:hypothetical protein
MSNEAMQENQQLEVQKEEREILGVSFDDQESYDTAKTILEAIETKFESKVDNKEFVELLKRDMSELKESTLDFDYKNMAELTKQNIAKAKSFDDIRIVSSKNDLHGLNSKLTGEIRTGRISPVIERESEQTKSKDLDERMQEIDRKFGSNREGAGLVSLSKQDPFTAFVEGCKSGYDPIHYMEEKRQRLMAIYYYISEKDDAGVVRSEDDENRVEQELNEKHGGPLAYLKDKIQQAQDKFEKAIGFSYVEYGKNRTFKENLQDMQFIRDSDKPTNDKEVISQFIEKKIQEAPVDEDSRIYLSRFIQDAQQRVLYDQAIRNLNEKGQYSLKIMNADREILSGQYANKMTSEEKMKAQEQAKSQGYVLPENNDKKEQGNSNSKGKDTSIKDTSLSR